MARTCKSLHNRLASGTGTAIRSRRLIVTPGRFSGVSLAERFSTHFRRPISHSARACRAVVLPELLGPTKTTVLPSSISTSSRRLKFLTRRLVSTSDDITAPQLKDVQAPAPAPVRQERSIAATSSSGLQPKWAKQSLSGFTTWISRCRLERKRGRSPRNRPGQVPFASPGRVTLAPS